MGNKFVVETWQHNNGNSPDGFSYVELYRGESFFKAFWIMLLSKLEGHRCLKMEWR